MLISFAICWHAGSCSFNIFDLSIAWIRWGKSSDLLIVKVLIISTQDAYPSFCFWNTKLDIEYVNAAILGLAGLIFRSHNIILISHQSYHLCHLCLFKLTFGSKYRARDRAFWLYFTSQRSLVNTRFALILWFNFYIKTYSTETTTMSSSSANWSVSGWYISACKNEKACIVQSLYTTYFPVFFFLSIVTW